MKKINRKKYTMGLFLIIFFYLSNVFEWTKLNQWPIGKDWHRHLANFSNIVNNLRQNNGFGSIFYQDKDYPPFYYLTALTLKIFFGVLQAVFFNSMLFFAILILSVYFIGKELKNKDAGFLAAIICSLFPVIYSASIQFNMELASVAMVSLAILMLLKSNCFRDRTFSFLFGTVVGLGILTRPFIVFFIIGPLMSVLFVPKGKREKIIDKQQMPNVVFALFISALIGLVFYHKTEIISVAIRRMNYEGKVTEGLKIFSLPHFLFYIKALPEQIGIFWACVLVLSIYYFNKLSAYIKSFILSWIIPAFLILTFVYLKYVQYTMPFLPAIALIIAFALEKIKSEQIKKNIALAVIIIGFCQFFKNF